MKQGLQEHAPRQVSGGPDNDKEMWFDGKFSHLILSLPFDPTIPECESSTHRTPDTISSRCSPVGPQRLLVRFRRYEGFRGKIKTRPTRPRFPAVPRDHSAHKIPCPDRRRARYVR